MSKHKNDKRKSSRKIKSQNENVKIGTWTDVKANQKIVEGAYVDGQGVLRDAKDHSVVTWHSTPKVRAAQGLDGSCQRRGITPDEISYDPETKAPWCPDCWPIEQKRREIENLIVTTKQIPLIGPILTNGIEKLFGRS